MRPLHVAPCQAVCAWSATGQSLGDLPLFACAGCGSEWVRTERWTPIGADGQVPAQVLAETRRRPG